jgi:N utilization substance protein B
MKDIYSSNPLIKRKDRRALILHVLYSAEMLEDEENLRNIINKYSNNYEIDESIMEDIIEEVQEIITNKDSIDTEIISMLKNWNIERISILIKLILRYAIWELKNKKTDVAIVINEAIELSHGFAEKDSYRIVNGILDMWVKKNKNI